jgi:hypothetical protein
VAAIAVTIITGLIAVVVFVRRAGRRHRREWPA